jgi:CRP-like cAMP-binding protein
MDERGIEALIATIERRDQLSVEEKDALVSLNWRTRDYPADVEIIPDGTEPPDSCLLLAGMAARSMSLINGERQITAVHVMGDFVDLHGLFLKVIDHSVTSLTPARVAFVDHGSLKEITRTMPHLARLLSMLVAIDAAVQRNWILSLGRCKAEARLANLLCELFRRLEIVGAVSDHSFDLPISQRTLADILGLSIVHTNRTLQHLRQSNLVSWRNGRVKILDWNGLARLAEFHPVYHNLIHEPR